MVTVNSTLNNFSEVPILIDLLGQFSNDYEYLQKEFSEEKLLHYVLYAIRLFGTYYG